MSATVQTAKHSEFTSILDPQTYWTIEQLPLPRLQLLSVLQLGFENSREKKNIPGMPEFRE